MFNLIRGKKKANSRGYRGVFKVKSRVKPRQVREIWSQQLEHKQVPKGGRKQVNLIYKMYYQGSITFTYVNFIFNFSGITHAPRPRGPDGSG